MIAEALEAAGIQIGPAARDYARHLPAKEVKRLKAMLDLGLENVDIASEMGLNRSAVMYHRRLYDAELIAAGKAPTSPIRSGRIPGRKLPPKQAAALKTLLLKGVPAERAALSLEVSRPCATRYRSSLVREMAAQGKTLPGCDLSGKVLGRKSPNALPDKLVKDIQSRLLRPERIPAIAAALGISTPTVRRTWHDLKPTLTSLPTCPCGKEAHHAQRCRPTAAPSAAELHQLIERLVPKHHDAALRQDIIQDIASAILPLPKPPANLAAEVRKAVASNYQRFANRWGDRSLDALISPDSDMTLMDVLAQRSTLKAS